MNRNQAAAADVTVVIPVHNSQDYLRECLDSCINCTNNLNLNIELSIYLDACTDSSIQITQEYQDKLNSNARLKLILSNGIVQGGVAYAKHEAIKQGSGNYLCFMDSDDIMVPDRIEKQYLMYTELEKANCNKLYLIGSRFDRLPEGSTQRFTRWANELTQEQLNKQIYTSNGPTIAAPTWFCSQNVYEKVGGFTTSQPRGFPEDLDFFYRFIKLGGIVQRHDDILMIYRYHPNCATFSVKEDTIWDTRIQYLQENVFKKKKWGVFTIWNAGKQGKKFYGSLSQNNRTKVAQFCDVDEKKIERGFYESYDAIQRKVSAKIPIIRHNDVKPPVIICVKLDMTSGIFESILQSKNWTEGEDYILFS